MAYVQKVISKEEQLHGIARLHWIYIVQGVMWFMVLGGFGWLLNSLIAQGLMMTASATSSMALPAVFVSATNWLTLFFLAGGFFLFMLFVIKVLFTEVGLSNRRVIYKTGMVFIKVQQIDLEEIRGENIDLGWFGRFLGYGYIMLDCRFIGDIRLPAIERPERFIRGLHSLRANTQDSLSVVVGKGNPKPLKVATDDVEMQGQRPDIEPGKPAPHPEVDPGNQPARPEIQPEPTPHAPPAPSNPPAQPVTPPPQPTQPIPAPPPSEPPLQPPTGQVQVMTPEDIAKIVQESMPQMAQQIVQELSDKGLLKNSEPVNDDPAVDNTLIHVFDDARHKEGLDPDDMHDKVERSVH